MVSPQHSRARESRTAIERLYIIMRHLFIRGSYKPMSFSGEALVKALLMLKPEIYGSMGDEERVELEGLQYVIDRLPKGIEECRQIHLITREGFESSDFEVIMPLKRRRNCYRVDQDQMYVELTRGRSDIYDIITHLTFLYVEAEKIKNHALDHKKRVRQVWKKLEQIVLEEDLADRDIRHKAHAYLSTILGRTFEETQWASDRFGPGTFRNSLFHIVYYLGKLAIEESIDKKDREIHFSSALRERIGHHVFGELWALHIKSYLYEQGLIERPLHIISANLHSVLNTLYASAVAKGKNRETLQQIAEFLSSAKNLALQEKVQAYAAKKGLKDIPDIKGTNINVQIIDTTLIDPDSVAADVAVDWERLKKEKPVILVMDYAFGEQAYESMDELLKPLQMGDRRIPLNVQSISIMGKAGILEGKKGDIMVPTAHVFEGTADNYPLDNEFSAGDFQGYGLDVCTGPMITVLGTSLQNRDVLEYFLHSSWRAIGLEMEGVHYQKAIQSASKIRRSISDQVKVRYAYYASDNPLVTGNTLASGSLGREGVKPTYLITRCILMKILS